MKSIKTPASGSYLQFSLLSFLFVILTCGQLHAQLIFTFNDNGDGRTSVTASGGTAIAAGGSDEGISFDFSRTGGFRSVDASFNYAGFIAEGAMDDILQLSSTGTNGIINVYEFDDNEFGFDLAQEADTGNTLSAIGALDTFGIIPLDFSFFAALHGQTLVSTVGWHFVFGPINDDTSGEDPGPDPNFLAAQMAAALTGGLIPQAWERGQVGIVDTTLNALHNQRILRARSRMANPRIENDTLARSDRHHGSYLNFAGGNGINLRQALGLEDVPASADSGGSTADLSRLFSVETYAGVELAAEPKRWEIFAVGDFGAFDQSSLDTVNRGFQSRTWASSTGFEYLVSPQLNLGAAYTYAENDTDLEAGLGNVDIEGHLASVYATSFRENNYLDLMYSYGSFENTLVRNTLTAGGFATGTPDSDTHAFSINAGHNFEVNELVTGPTIGYDYTTASLDGFSETGGGFAALNYQSRDFQSSITSLGWHVSKTGSVHCGTLTLQAFTSWEHEFAGEGGITQASLINFGTPVNPGQPGNPGTDWWVLGAGALLSTYAGLDFGVDYQTQLFRDDVTAHFVGLKVSGKF